MQMICARRVLALVACGECVELFAFEMCVYYVCLCVYCVYVVAIAVDIAVVVPL